MNALASEVVGAPQSLHRGENDLPFVPYQEGVLFQLLQVNTETGLWVIRVRFEPGVTIQRHRHTGEVFAFTIRGSWRYLEYPDINVAGSYLFEPAGAVHTLHVPATNKEITDVWFAIRCWMRRRFSRSTGGNAKRWDSRRRGSSAARGTPVPAALVG